MSGRSPSPPLNRRNSHRSLLQSNRNLHNRASVASNMQHQRLPHYSRANSNNLQQRDSLDDGSAEEMHIQRAVNLQQQPADDSDGGDSTIGDESASGAAGGSQGGGAGRQKRRIGAPSSPDIADPAGGDGRAEASAAGAGVVLDDDVDEPMLQPVAFYDEDEEDDDEDGRPGASVRYNRRNDFRDAEYDGDEPSDMAANYAPPTNSAAIEGGDVGMASGLPLAAPGAAATVSAAMRSHRHGNTGGVFSLGGVLIGSGSNNNQNPLHNWQSTKHTLKERFSFMFCNEILADVHFIVGRGEQRIPAHKFVLSVGSAVFDAMFNGAMASHTPDDIELPDIEPTAFLALLKFMYSDDFQIGPESVMTTLYTAKKYAVPALEYACVDFLKRNLNADNAFMLLTQARLFDETPLAKLCLEMIDKHTAEALNAEGFTDIHLDTLSAVIERDTLRIREVALFHAVVRWSVEECHRRQFPVTSENQRQVLGRALHLIRFPLMTVEEFAQTAAQSAILTDREVVNLFLFFTVNPKPSVGFLDVPRCCVTGKEQIVNRFQKIEGRWGYSGTPDRIKFNVDRRIFVVGFGLYGSIHGPSEYQVTIQIIHCGSGKVMASNDTSFQCDGSLNTFRVLFKEPVEITPAVTYIASTCLKGVDSHYGAKGVRRIVHQSNGGCSITFQFTYAAGNNNGTSVEDGQIPEFIFYTKLNA